MDKRYLIFFAIVAPLYIGTLLYINFMQKKYPAPTRPKVVASQPAAQTPSESMQPLGPQVANAPTTGTATSSNAGPETFGSVIEPRPEVPLEKIMTETFEVDFSPLGAVPVRWLITDPRYAIKRETKGTSASLILADETEEGNVPLIDPELDPKGLPRPLEVVLRELNARFYNEFNSARYTVTRPQDDANFETVRFESPVTESGLQLIKTYRLPKSGFQSYLTLEFVNQGKSKLTFNNQALGLGMTLGPGLGPGPTGGGGIGSGRLNYVIPFYKIPTGLVSRVPDKSGSPTDYPEPNLGIEFGGINKHYFLMSIRPDGQSAAGKGFAAVRTKLDLDVVNAGISSEKGVTSYPRVELYGTPFSLTPGQSTKFAYEIFAGPKDRQILKSTGSGLEHILFYDSWGWMRALCFLLMQMLTWFESLAHNWGVALILLVVTVRLVTWPLTQMGMKQQAKMMAQQAKLKPYTDVINAKYKDDAQKKNQEMMKLYREHNVNPLGAFKGCIWVLIQLPILAALYKILNQSIDLRGASFLWIDDLSQPERLFRLPFTVPMTGENYFNLLPILTAMTQVVVSRMSMKANPAAADNPTQKQMMYMMPVMILLITYSMPSGLALYWVISNIWQLLQQKFVNNKYMMPPPGTPAPAVASK